MSNTEIHKNKTTVFTDAKTTEPIKVEKFIPGGQTIATNRDGKKIFFWNALPEETVTEYQVTKKKSNYEEAIAVSVEHQSPYRVTPKDTCFLSTSPWQNLEYTYELSTKQALIKEIFSQHQIDVPLPLIFTDHQDYYYRNKMEYALYWNRDTEKIDLAFHQRGSHRKIPIQNSSIERPELFTKATEIIDQLNAHHDEARKYQSLLLRCNQKGEISGGLYENHKPHPIFDHLTDTIIGTKYSYSPNGFFQINLPVYELALKEIKKYISTENVLDLYSGVGTIGLSVASDRQLTLIECDKSAFTELIRNITSLKTTKSDKTTKPVTTNKDLSSTKSNTNNKLKINNILAILAKSEDVTEYIAPDQTVILDPPRAGCDIKLIDKLNEIRPQKIIYLSCNPVTQARDIKCLLQNYHIEDIKTFNFFPRTPHIENLVVLSR